MATKVFRSYTRNGHTYTVCEYADGSRIEIKGPVGQKPADAIAQADVLYAAEQARKAEEAAAEEALANDPRLSIASVGQLKTEVQKRHLTAADLGLNAGSVEAVK